MSVTCQKIMDIMERLAPCQLAEEWDNVGLLIGDPGARVEGVLVSLDLTVQVMEEARARGANLILVHHPPIFQPLKQLRTDTPLGRLVAGIIRENMQVYAAHTNLDVVPLGVNEQLARKLGLVETEILQVSGEDRLFKLVVFVPDSHEVKVRQSLGDAGAGWIGNYSHCTFRLHGTGTFRPLEGADPFLGQVGRLEEAAEYRLETIVPETQLKKVVKALLASHPYEEVAYDLYPLSNRGIEYGLGRVGKLIEPVPFSAFIEYVKLRLGTGPLKVAGNPEMRVERVAVCGGAGGSLVSRAALQKAQVFVTGDVGHHQVQEALALGLGVIDAGHYATERVVLNPLVDYLKEALSGQSPVPAVFSSEINSEPWELF
ncbi:MAG TPA: Nif3-like dinuclear metal center hexameric protein [Clostridia bacterium]|nr:Nif3-like dinuclear metal center hexameric protein [Clostridia bacterium]